jgi:hypothetical protein
VSIAAIAAIPNAPSIFTLAMLHFHFMDYEKICRMPKTLQDGPGDVKHFIVKTKATPLQKKAGDNDGRTWSIHPSARQSFPKGKFRDTLFAEWEGANQCLNMSVWER